MQVLWFSEKTHEPGSSRESALNRGTHTQLWDSGFVTGFRLYLSYGNPEYGDYSNIQRMSTFFEFSLILLLTRDD